mmetsp:Transcript_34503/g.74596  ORF Transcript_34503/g.74596 Transcript_34503/m.74596 type:complete len:311 (+) Transcript_34503:74-1006(+)
MPEQRRIGNIILASLLLCRSMGNPNRAQAQNSWNRDEEQAVESQTRQLQSSVLPSSLALSTTSVAFGNYGVMFYVGALGDITVTSIQMYTRTIVEGAPVQVYTRPGKYIGFEGSAAGWSKIYDNPSLELLGQDISTTLIGLDVSISSSAFQSFFIWSPNGKIQYNPGTTEGALYSSNSYIEFYEGAGVRGIFTNSPDDITAPRVMRGVLNFDVMIAEDPGTPEPSEICPGGVEVRVHVATDDYPDETSWILTNTCTGAIQEISPLYNDDFTEHVNSYCVPSADYTIEFKDKWGDGICCEEGPCYHRRLSG